MISEGVRRVRTSAVSAAAIVAQKSMPPHPPGGALVVTFSFSFMGAQLVGLEGRLKSMKNGLFFVSAFFL
jgi:hypothetical protein